MASAWVYNDGRYSQKALAVGFAAVAFSNIYVFAMYAIFMLRLPGVPAIYGNVLEGVVRWHALVLEGTSPLVRHEDGDSMCPCHALGCTGRLPAAFGWSRFVTIATMLVLSQLATFIFPAWTPLAAAASIGLLFTLVTNLFSVLSTNPSYAALIELSNRVQLRSVDLSLRSTLASLLARLDSAERGLPPPQPSPAAPDIDLARSRHLFALIFPGWILPCIFTAAAAGCINIGLLLCNMVGLVLVGNDLAVLAASNAGPGKASDRYAAAAGLLREWTARAGYAGDEKLAGEMRDWEGAVRAFGELDGVRARMWGIAIGWGGLRSFAAGAGTLAIGVWTLLRSAGVVLTVESFCPAAV